MDFVICLLRINKGYNILWVIVNGMSQVYVKEIMKLYGVLEIIMSDKDTRFVLAYW